QARPLSAPLRRPPPKTAKPVGARCDASKPQEGCANSSITFDLDSLFKDLDEGTLEQLERAEMDAEGSSVFLPDELPTSGLAVPSQQPSTRTTTTRPAQTRPFSARPATNRPSSTRPAVRPASAGRRQGLQQQPGATAKEDAEQMNIPQPSAESRLKSEGSRANLEEWQERKHVSRWIKEVSERNEKEKHKLTRQAIKDLNWIAERRAMQAQRLLKEYGMDDAQKYLCGVMQWMAARRIQHWWRAVASRRAGKHFLAPALAIPSEELRKRFMLNYHAFCEVETAIDLPAHAPSELGKEWSIVNIQSEMGT
ncbi:hypothetical protein CYMTET_35869, partial [Cymbomonas tetramitiformis]